MLRAICIVSCLSACTAADPERTPDAGGGSACEEASGHADLAWIQANVFTTSCAIGVCHRGAALSAGRLSLELGLARDQLVGVASTSAAGWSRIVAGDRARSYLMVAIGAEAGPLPSDGVMPLGAPVLCSEKRDAIGRWIAAGAPP